MVRQPPPKRQDPDWRYRLRFRPRGPAESAHHYATACAKGSLLIARLMAQTRNPQDYD